MARTPLRVALLLVLSGAAVLAVDQFVPGAGDRLSRASPGWLAGALALELAGCAG